MNIQDLETDTLKAATDALKEQTGMALTAVDGWATTKDIGYDAMLETGDGGRFYAEVKAPAARINMGRLVNQVREIPGVPILVTDYINPKLADRLRQQEVQFLDGAGNAYINQPQRYIFIKGCKPPAPDR